MLNTIKREWFSNIRGDLLAGTVVALALIPEAIAFSIIAGVDPKVGLYASFCIAVIIAFVGGRPGMISAATGAMSLLMVTLVKEHGLEYLLAASLLCGVIQIGAGYLKLGDLMRFVSRSVVTGFVNALAILIFMAQLPELTNVTWHVYAMTAAGLGIIYLFPYVPKVGSWLPSPLVCILTITAVAMIWGIDVRTVADMGELPDTLPIFLWPDVPLTLETLWIILPYSLALAAVGLLESMMTSTIVDELTDTDSNKNRECKGQGVANIGSSLLGGMAGCAMIGQSLINIKSGGRGRTSGITAAVALAIFIMVGGPVIGQIPVAALVGVMFMVVIGTFEWSTFKSFGRMPHSEVFVILAVTLITVFMH
ncbi:MAG: SulP family inorganic anion transporter, partial [Thalassolituus sp.]